MIFKRMIQWTQSYAKFFPFSDWKIMHTISHTSYFSKEEAILSVGNVHRIHSFSHVWCELVKFFCSDICNAQLNILFQFFKYVQVIFIHNLLEKPPAWQQQILRLSGPQILTNKVSTLSACTTCYMLWMKFKNIRVIIYTSTDQSTLNGKFCEWLSWGA